MKLKIGHDPIMYKIGKLAGYTLSFEELEKIANEASKNISDLSIVGSLIFDLPLRYHSSPTPSQMTAGIIK